MTRSDLANCTGGTGRDSDGIAQTPEILSRCTQTYSKAVARGCSYGPVERGEPWPSENASPVAACANRHLLMSTMMRANPPDMSSVSRVWIGCRVLKPPRKSCNRTQPITRWIRAEITDSTPRHVAHGPRWHRSEGLGSIPSRFFVSSGQDVRHLAPIVPNCPTHLHGLSTWVMTWAYIFAVSTFRNWKPWLRSASSE